MAPEARFPPTFVQGRTGFGVTALLQRVVRLPDKQLERIDVVRSHGVWHQRMGARQWLIPLPGARDFTVAEFVGERYRRTHRYGEWLEISRDVAQSAPPFLQWCQRNANSELPSGGFRFHPGSWSTRCQDPLPLPFLPEFDHQDPTIRTLAGTERERRILQHRLKALAGERQQAIRAAVDAGYSRRTIAKLLGISFARVQQLAGSSG